MSTVTTEWTRPEFKAYLMTYAANANYFESEDELDIIHNFITNDQFKKIHREWEKDNDYQSIQKILHNIEKFEYSKDELEDLVGDIKKLFNADGQFDLLESNMLLALKKIIM